ncbi:unnamed protein product, partial [Choristocarpus tenellus]
MRGSVDRRTPPPSRAGLGSESGGGSERKRDSCLAEIQRLEKARAVRRNRMELARAERAAEEARNIANGNPGDVDFQRMIQDFREQSRAGTEVAHSAKRDVKICIAVRKRPTSSKERARKDHDSVSCYNPEVTVHDCKLRVDGISKYLDSVRFRFDHTFGENNTNQETGSGKTYTMVGIQ